MARKRSIFQWLRDLFRPTPRKPGKAPGSADSLSGRPNLTAGTPEAMCGIHPREMSREEIRIRLAELYRRHNQAAGSLNEELRQEAELMLDAIVACREKYVD